MGTAFDLEDKITWDELSPSLQNKLNKLGYTEAEIRAFAKDEAATYFNDNKSTIINEAMSSTPTGNLKTYIDTLMFLNLPPKLGYLDNNKAELYASYNMSWNTVYCQAHMYISDAEGRTNMYFKAAKSSSSEEKIFRAYKVFESGTFSFENDPVVPGYMTKDRDYLTHVISLAVDHMVVRAVIDGNVFFHVIFTNYSGTFANWTTYKDITKVVNNIGMTNILGVYWDAKTDKYLFCHYTNYYVYIDVYDTNMNLFASHAVVDVTPSGKADWKAGHGSFDWTNSDPGWPTRILCDMYSTDLNSGFFTVDTTNRVILFGFQTRFELNYLSDPTVYSGNYGYALIGFGFKYSDDLFTNVYYSPYIPSNSHAYHNRRGFGYSEFGMTYDSLLNRYISSSHSRDMSYFNDTYYTLDTTKAVSEAIFDTLLVGSKESVEMSPDASPWAKKNLAPVVYGENLYLHGYSKAYGDTRVAFEMEYSSSKDNTREFAVKASSWEIVGIPGMNYSCSMASSNSASCYILDGNQIKKLRMSNRPGKNGKTYNDVINWDATGLSVPAYSPSGYVINRVAYNSADNCVYYILTTTLINKFTTKADVLANPIVKVTKYSLSSGSYSDVINVWYKDYKSELDSGYSNTLDSANYVGNIIVNISNVFFSWDGYAYTDLYQIVSGSIYTYGKFIFNWRTNSIVSFSPNISFKWHSGNWNGDTESIGYNNRFGFYATGGTSFYVGFLYSSKDPFGLSGSTYTELDTLQGSGGYVSNINTAGSTGLVVSLANTPIFLGGYFSIKASEEIALMDNCTNYIYLHRDPLDREKVDIEVYDRPLGKVPTSSSSYSDATQFSRVLIAKIITKNGSPVDQELYDIGDPYYT